MVTVNITNVKSFGKRQTIHVGLNRHKKTLNSAKLTLVVLIENKRKERMDRKKGRGRKTKTEVQRWMEKEGESECGKD